jgi:hypothetical protein
MTAQPPFPNALKTARASPLVARRRRVATAELTSKARVPLLASPSIRVRVSDRETDLGPAAIFATAVRVNLMIPPQVAAWTTIREEGGGRD